MGEGDGVNTAVHIKNTIVAACAAVGGVLSSLWGGWDALLRALIVCMIVDYITGIAVAAIGKSNKSLTGHINSNAAVMGLLKKGFELLVVLVAAQLGGVSGGEFVRDTVVLFFIGSEGISIIENGGLLGVPLPASVKRWFELLHEKNGGGDDGEGIE